MRRTSQPVRVAVVGCGSLGQALASQVVDDERARLVALADVDSTTRATAGDELGVPPDARYADYEQLLADEELDAVVIATPHTLHYEQVTAAMDAGLHVLCEKPLTTETAQARELTDRAEASETVLMVGFQRHLEPAFERARKRWATGENAPTFVTAEITQNWIASCAGTWRTDPALSGGGFLYDTGIHILDAVCWTTGLRPAWVDAEMQFHDDGARVDERAHLTVGFENDATASISVYGDAPAVREHIHVWDDDGAIYLTGRGWDQRTVTEIDAANTTTEPYLRTERPAKASAFLDAVLKGTTPPATARDALVVTALADAAYESARTGERVEIEW